MKTISKTTTKSSKINKKQSVSKRKLAAIGVMAIVTAITVANSLTLVYLYYSGRISYDNDKIVHLILRGSQLTSKPAVIEPLSGKVYLPDAKLVLPPASEEVGEIVYRYSPAYDVNSKEEINIARTIDIVSAGSKIISAPEDIEKKFEGVPELQACSRGIRITFEPDAALEPVATKKLTNGKTAHFYTEVLCNNPQLITYVQQIDSY